MMEMTPPRSETTPLDPGLRALCGIAAYYRIAADPVQLARALALGERAADETDLIRAAKLVGLKARLAVKVDAERLMTLPTPAIVRMAGGAVMVLAGRSPLGLLRLVDPISHAAQEAPLEDVARDIGGRALLVARQIGGAGADPQPFGISWFLPTLWRYRRPLGHVLAASLFVPIFALTTPLFFQVVVDKVLAHRGYETLFVLVGGLVIIGLFDVALQYLRTYALAHTTNRIDVELGQRLFAHLLSLPISYFETRSTGQTVARVMELETIRSFLTGQALFSAIDLIFAFVFVGVLFAYSWSLTLIVLAAVPFYALIGFCVRPPLRAMVKEKFNRGAASQQFLVETIAGMNTVKAAAVEPIMRAQWEEKLAAYVKTSFAASMLGSGGQLGIQYLSKLTTAALLLFGAKAVIDGNLTVGALVAFNMIAAQAVAPILRLSQIWQDFQQVHILDRPPRRHPQRPARILAGDAPGSADPARRDRISPRQLPLPAGRARGAEGRFARHPGRRDDRNRRPVGVRQIDPDQARSAPLSPDRGAGAPGRRGPRPCRSGVAEKPHRRRAAGEPAVQPHRSREHRLRQSGDVARAGDRDRPARRRRRVYRQARAWLRYADRGARRESLRRAEAAHRHRPRARHQSAHSHFRRGDLVARLRERADHPAQHAPHRQGSHRHHHRPSPGRGARDCDRIVGISDGHIVEVGTHAELVRRPGGLYAYLLSLQSQPAEIAA